MPQFEQISHAGYAWVRKDQVDTHIALLDGKVSALKERNLSAKHRLAAARKAGAADSAEVDILKKLLEIMRRYMFHFSIRDEIDARKLLTQLDDLNE